MGRPNHRIAADTVAGRRMTQAKGTSGRLGVALNIPQSIREQNAAIERARAQDLERRKLRKKGEG